MSEPPRSDSYPPQPPRKATLGEVFMAVFWSFFGVRKGTHMQRDAVTIRPRQVVIVGVAAGAIFVLTLIAIVRVILRAAAA